jgi:hypothetical protein
MKVINKPVYYCDFCKKDVMCPMCYFAALNQLGIAGIFHETFKLKKEVDEFFEYLYPEDHY